MTTSAVETTYDSVPYPELCHEATHPARLAAVARLHGLTPAPARHCRVLDIGCASGTNLASMAFGLPDSTFVGIDLAPRQIEAAQAFADDLGLTNVRFLTMDLMDVTPALGTFDYVVAHGLYSWVPVHVRDRLLATCRDHLAPHGVAFVSSNMLPGWHMLGMIREMMRYRTRHISDPGERARTARSLLVRLHAATPDDDRSALATFIRTYVKVRLGRFGGHDAWEDSMLVHDELAEINDPVLFHEFVDHAGRFGLQYLADATHPQSPVTELSPDTARLVGELAGDLVDYEQYLDFACHRTFRRTLLCHDAVTVVRGAGASVVGELYATAPLRPARDADDEDEEEEDEEPRPEDPLIAAAVQILGEGAPRPVQVASLLADACRRVGAVQPDADALTRLSHGLLAAATSGDDGVQLLADAPPMAVHVSERPCVSPVARHQLQQSPFVCTLLHEQIELRGLDVPVAALLDGRRTRNDVRAELLAHVESGRLRSPGGGELDRRQLEAMLDSDLDGSLRRLGRLGLLLA